MIKQPAALGESFHETKGSRFWGRTVCVADVEAVQAALSAMRADHPDATALAYAYTCGTNQQTARFSDGGEPGGTAGLPMMEIIKQRDLSYTLVMVARIFGGVHLGAGGLVRAFSHTAAAALNAAGTVTLQPGKVWQIACAYAMSGKVAHFLSNSPYPLLERSFHETVTFTVRVPDTGEAAFLHQISGLTQAQATVTAVERGMFPE